MIIAGDERGFIDYYSGRETFARLAPVEDRLKSGGRLREKIGAFKSGMDAFLSQGRPVYVTESAFYSGRLNLFEALLKRHYDLQTIAVLPFEAWHHDFRRVEIYPCGIYRLRPRDAPPVEGF